MSDSVAQVSDVYLCACRKNFVMASNAKRGLRQTLLQRKLFTRVQTEYTSNPNGMVTVWTPSEDSMDDVEMSQIHDEVQTTSENMAHLEPPRLRRWRSLTDMQCGVLSDSESSACAEDSPGVRVSSSRERRSSHRRQRRDAESPICRRRSRSVAPVSSTSSRRTPTPVRKPVTCSSAMTASLAPVRSRDIGALLLAA